MQQFTENEIREALREILEENKKQEILSENYYAVNMGWEDLYQGLIAPWINVLKIAKVEAQKTLASILYLFRVAITFNTQKLQRLRARHKDRMKMLDEKTKELVGKYSDAESNMIAFMIAPGAVIANKAIQLGTGGAQEVADFFKEAGFGDFGPGELESPDSNVDRLERSYDEANPIMKALRALDSLFMAGYEAPGKVLAEQEDLEQESGVDYSEVNIDPSAMEQILDMGGAMDGILAAREQLEQDANDFLKAVTTAESLTKVLSSSKTITNLNEYMSFLEEIKKISPETATTGRAALEKALDNDVKKILSAKGAQEEAAQSYLSAQGVKEPTEEELAAVTEEQKMAQIRSIAFGNIIGRLRAGAEESVSGIYENHKSLYDTMYDENMDAATKSIIDASPYGQTMKKAKSILDSIKKSSQSLGA